MSDPETARIIEVKRIDGVTIRAELPFKPAPCPCECERGGHYP